MYLFNYAVNEVKTPAIAECSIIDDDLEIKEIDGRVSRFALDHFKEQQLPIYGAEEARQIFKQSIEERKRVINVLYLPYAPIDWAISIVYSIALSSLALLSVFSFNSGSDQYEPFQFEYTLLKASLEVVRRSFARGLPSAGFEASNEYLREEIAIGNQNLALINEALSRNATTMATQAHDA